MSDTSGSNSFPFGQEVVWRPDEGWIRASNLQAFMDRHEIASFDDLMRRSTEDVNWFWTSVVEDLDVRFYERPDRVFDPGEQLAFPSWCRGGSMNIIHNCLDKRVSSGQGDAVALIWEGEEGTVVRLTYRELDQLVCRCANALSQLGIVKGDAVGLFMPMTVELVVAFLAVIKIGGIVLPLFSGYGAAAVATRLKDADARVLFTSDGFFRRGKTIAMKPVADAALSECPTVEHVVVLNRAGIDVDMIDGRDLWWHEVVPSQSDHAETVRTGAEDVLMIIYTSGTTGRPKGAVHTHCGFPIKGAQDMYHSMDVKAGEVMYWMTDMGWMMGPWLVFGTMVIGATMVIADGAPDYPGPGRLWEMVERHRVTHLGVSPVLMRSLIRHGTSPVVGRDLSSLRAMGSTGSPWDPDSWLWTFKNVLEGRKPILNYSGGTEISGGIICGNFFKPLKPCSFSGPVPGMAADVVDSEGRPVRGEVGELVVRRPWIGMTRGFWRDNDRYIESYWSRFPGIWVHGDFAAIDADGLWYILGRSDDTIKVAGKRVGPAEVEAVVNANPRVAESAAIGVPDETKGEALVVFCAGVEDRGDLEALRSDLLDAVASALGKPLRPKQLLFVDALPKTRNSKVMRRVIRAAHLGLDAGDISSLEDPSTVDSIRAAV